ncbi:MAG: poly(A) polymerase [Nitriliruptoraceae bacterium]|jgi:poly(A) polymerase
MPVPTNQLTAEQAAHLGGLLDVFPPARQLGELFDAAGHELYLVGGTVRDALLAGDDVGDDDGLDLDFATSARPADTEALLRAWTADHGTVFLTGARFGTVSAVRDQRQVEITTFRSDEYEPDSRHPEVTFGDTLAGDLARRDFTVNAMAVRVPSFEFVDLFGGLSDLQARVLRTPIDPEISFGDDPLRMLRLARFASQLGATAEPATHAAAMQMADRLRTVSAERIQAELCKMMLGAEPRRGLVLLTATGLSKYSLPELDDLRACVDPDHRHKDVWEHTLAVIENAIALEDRLPADDNGRRGPDLVLRLAALMHDIGKPATRQILDRGKVTFHHHEMEGWRQTKARMAALKFDKGTTKAVSELVKLHLRFHGSELWTDAAVRRYVRDAGDQLERLNALTRADVTTGNERKARRIQRRVDELEQRILVLEQEEELGALRPPIDGKAIMAHLDIPPSRLVGEAWNHLLELRIELGLMDEAAAFAALDGWWADRQAADAEPDEA